MRIIIIIVKEKEKFMAIDFNKYQEEFKKEAPQFTFLLCKEDLKILVRRYKRKNLDDNVRLACIALVFGFKNVFLKIFATAQRDTKKFIAKLDSLKGNYALFEDWINKFIDGVQNEAVRNLIREYWEEREQKIDKDNFTVQQIL